MSRSASWVSGASSDEPPVTIEMEKWRSSRAVARGRQVRTHSATICHLPPQRRTEGPQRAVPHLARLTPNQPWPKCAASYYSAEADDPSSPTLWAQLQVNPGVVNISVKSPAE